MHIIQAGKFFINLEQLASVNTEATWRSGNDGHVTTVSGIAIAMTGGNTIHLTGKDAIAFADIINDMAVSA